jgi:membrane protease YdiL (CAAX protease family)
MYVIIGRLIPNYIYNENSLRIIVKQEVVYSFSTKSYSNILIFFPITMIIEELIFRFYLLGLFFEVLNVHIAILFGAVIFSVYHIHFWFAFKNLKVVTTYMIFSFFLGLLNGYIFNYFGLVVCIVFHSFSVLDVYYQLYKKIKDKKIEIP